MKILRWPVSLLISLALVVPVSPNYALRELDFASGGGTGQSTNYNFEGIIGEQGTPLSGTAYDGGLGFGFTQMAFVPEAPTFTNPDNYYNKLQLIINPSGNPSDALYAIAISSDNFATSQYIKSDHGVSNTLTFADYQSYASWGGASGFEVLGLEPGTQYYAKVKAYHGDFTESAFGPSATASTINPTLTFDIDVAATDTPTSPPYIFNLGTLTAGNVLTGSDKIWVSLDTNAQSGANVYVAGQNGALESTAASYSIPSATGDLDILSEGFGMRVDTVTQASGGPFSAASPYDVSGNLIGNIATTYQTLFTSTSPLTSGRGSALLKAKSSSQTPAQSDYTEILTIVGAANF